MPDPTPPTPPTPPAPGAKPPGEGTPPTPPAPPAPADESGKKLEAVLAQLEEVKREAIERRHENKELKARLTALGGAEAQEAITKAAARAAAADAAIRQAAIVSVLAREGAHDPLKAAKLIDLSDVEVDAERFAIKDPTVLAAKVKDFKKTDPWAFLSAAPPAGDPPPPPATPTPAPPKPPTTGDSPYEAWKKLMAAGKAAEAHALWVKHPEIKDQIQ